MVADRKLTDGSQTDHGSQTANRRVCLLDQEARVEASRDAGIFGLQVCCNPLTKTGCLGAQFAETASKFTQKIWTLTP